MIEKGKFIISLDFELLWGVLDVKTIENYGGNLVKVWEILPKTLELFNNYKVHATIATVGTLFAENLDELQLFFPIEKPTYTNKKLSSYNYLENKYDIKKNTKCYFASELISKINSNHEIATHTFSHYYCLEDGQTAQQFKLDLQAAISIANFKNTPIKSIVFPRNQFNKEYLSICKKLGILSYRGNEKSWFYRASKGVSESRLKRLFRLLDSYINISGKNTYTLKEISRSKPFNIPSSRFLRPYNSKLAIFEKIRLQRILKSMTFAAKNNQVFHLWWHPHNFGNNTDKNFANLIKILEHYKKLNLEYSFESVTMNQLSTLIENKYV